MNKEKVVPKIRFKMFSEGLKEFKLGSITDRVRGNDGRMELLTLTISAGNGWLDQRERFSGNIAGKEQKNYTLLRKGELSYNKGNSKLAKYGVVFMLDNFEEALVPRVYHSFRVTKNASARYIEYLFATKKPDRELRKLITSGARMDGLLNINYDDFMGIKITIPKVEEQIIIGSFFNKVDETIRLQQQLLNDHKQLKKSMLQKMFPKKGESIPRVRFSGFSDKWNEDKIENLLIERNERSGEGELISVTINSGVVKTADLNRTDNSSKDKSNYKKVEKDDIAYNSMRMWQGASGVSKYTGIVSPAYTIIIPKENVSSLFISYLFKLPSMIQTFQANSQGLTSDTWNLKYPMLKKIKIKLPELKEQQRISEFFKQLDESIDFHEQKLETYQNFKKAMLQKMFV